MVFGARFATALPANGNIKAARVAVMTTESLFLSTKIAR
jgi:hypothetical protein